MQEPFLATIILGLAWSLTRLPKGRSWDWEQSSHDLDRRLPGIFAGVRRRPGPRPRRRPETGGVVVEPDRPNNLTGGAAAELDFS